MRLGIWDAFGLGAAVRDEEETPTQGIVSKAIDAIKKLLCSDKTKED